MVLFELGLIKKIIQIDEESLNYPKTKKTNIQAVVDRIIVKDGIRSRLYSSIETALKWESKSRCFNSKK